MLSRSDYVVSGTVETGLFIGGPIDGERARLLAGRHDWREDKWEDECGVAEVAKRPERNAKIAAAVKRMHERPGYTEERASKIQQTLRRRLREEPELRKRYEEIGRAAGNQHGGNTCAPDVRAAATAKARAKRLAHIPLEYRDEYIALERKTGLHAAERAEVIRSQVERDTERFLRTGELQRTGGKS